MLLFCDHGGKFSWEVRLLVATPLLLISWQVSLALCMFLCNVVSCHVPVHVVYVKKVARLQLVVARRLVVCCPILVILWVVRPTLHRPSYTTLHNPVQQYVRSDAVHLA